jgi:Zn-dependent metalloprotease
VRQPLARAAAGIGLTAALATAAPVARAVPSPATPAAQQPDTPGSDGTALHLPSDQRLTVRSVVTDPNGTRHVRYDRTWRGLPVLGGDLIVDHASTGAITSARWNTTTPIAPATATPAVSATAAADTGVRKAGPAVRAAKPAGSTVVVWAGSGTARLAYDVLTTGVKADQTPTRLHTIVDATSGSVITAYDDIKTGTGNSMYSGSVTLNTISSGSSWLLKDAHGNYTTDLLAKTSGTGTQLTDADNIWGDGTAASRQTAAVDAEYGAERTFAYWSSVQHRQGVWDNGTGARSRVHYGNAYVNAFWDGTQMTYGDGSGNTHPLTSLDVAAHEMAHGVTENTANLTYSGESGGINEATSDIFGTAVEFYASNASDVGDYLIGEKIDINGNGTPLRYLDRPSRDGRSPDCWSSSVKNLDVHYSSGPLNHWFYLASEGSGAKTINGVSYNSPTCNASTVIGTGHRDVELVWYRTLATKLTSSSTYAAAREGAIASATELYGADSPQCLAVESAFSAINVPAGAHTCGGGGGGGGTGDNLLQNPGFESGATVWTASSGAITSSSSRPARTGSWKLWLGGYGRRVSEYGRQSVAIPASATTATLTFWVRIDTSERTTTRAYDTLKAQLVSGGTTTLATYSNLDATNSYVQRSFDVTAFKGRTVTVKFAGKEDSSLQTSFVVDDTALTVS